MPVGDTPTSGLSVVRGLPSTLVGSSAKPVALPTGVAAPPPPGVAGAAPGVPGAGLPGVGAALAEAADLAAPGEQGEAAAEGAALVAGIAAPLLAARAFGVVGA